jgi:uncharacterized protein (DUF1501 family)
LAANRPRAKMVRMRITACARPWPSPDLRRATRFRRWTWTVSSASIHRCRPFTACTRTAGWRPCRRCNTRRLRNRISRGQDIIENATTLPSTTGWLGRYLATLPSGAQQKAFALTVGVPRSLLGTVPVSAIPDLRGLSLAATKADQDMLGARLASEYSRLPLAGQPYDASLRAAGRQLQTDVAELQSVDALPVANGATYPATTFGRQMRQAAGLLKTRPGIELVGLDLCGWDTHRAQGAGQPDGTQAMLLSQLSEATAAFYADLGSAASGVLLLAVTEFGRTAAENSSGGTDHGNASTWLAVGPMVRGGVHTVSGWPGLAPTQLDRGRYVAQSTDYRVIYGEILTRHLGVANPSSLLTSYAPRTVGFL